MAGTSLRARLVSPRENPGGLTELQNSAGTKPQCTKLLFFGECCFLGLSPASSAGAAKLLLRFNGVMAVADAIDGLDQRGVGGIGFDPLAKLADRLIQRATVGNDLHPPATVEQFAATDYFTATIVQHPQQSQLAR